MGMDVAGRAATSKHGEYFRANVWHWHPLATLIQQAFPAIAAGCVHWHTNDGDGLDAAGSIALADALSTALADGTVDAYIQARNKAISELPMPVCTLCAGTGIRADAIGIQYGYDKPRDPVTNTGGCNSCAGFGKEAPWESNYRLDPDLIHRFADFLRTSGGFEIW